MHSTCVAQGTSYFLMISVSCAHPNKTFSIHTSCLSLVFRLCLLSVRLRHHPGHLHRRWLESDQTAVHSAKRMDSLALWPHDIPPHPFRELCEEPDRMFSKNCVVWTSTWAWTPINVVSYPQPFFLLYFLFLWRLFWKFCFYSIFSFLLSIFSVKKQLSSFWTNWRIQHLFSVAKKNLFVLSVVEVSALLFAICCWIFPKSKQTSALHFTTKLCSCSLLYFCK